MKNASDLILSDFLPKKCAHCGWADHHPPDCPNYVIPATGKPKLWSLLCSCELIVEVSPDGKGCILRRRTVMDFVRPSHN